MTTHSREFNDIFSVLKHAHGSNYNTLLHDLLSTGYVGLLEFVERQNNTSFHDYEECIMPALEYFIETYIPGNDGKPPKYELRQTGQAFSLLRSKLISLFKDTIDRNIVRRNRQEKISSQNSTKGNSVRHGIIQAQQFAEMQGAIAAGLYTKTGRLHVRGLVSRGQFSSAVKRGAYLDYWENVLTKNEGPRQRAKTTEIWQKEKLPLYRSIPDEEYPDGREMTWNEFHAYFHKASRRIKAIVLQKLESNTIDASFFGAHAISPDEKQQELRDGATCHTVKPSEMDTLIHWVRQGQSQPLPQPLEGVARHLAVCPDCRVAFFGHFADPFDDENYGWDVGFLLKIMQQLLSSFTNGHTKGNNGDEEKRLDDSLFE